MRAVVPTSSQRNRVVPLLTLPMQVLEVARRRCQAETGNGRERRSSKQAHRNGVLGYKGARRKRLV